MCKRSIEEPQISCIVPVYNVEKYLHRCVDSILGQSFGNFELILVDDGSPDNCGKICDEYAKKDSRVKVIHQENKGVSAARNAGLDAASGEYICFVDSDDWVENDAYKNFDSILNGENIKHDVYIFKTRKAFANGMYRDLKKYKKNPVSSDYIEYGHWSQIFNRKFVTSNKIRYPENITLAEDWFFLYQVHTQTQNVLFVDSYLYNYCCNDESVTEKISEKNISDHIKVIEMAEKFPYKNTESIIHIKQNLKLFYLRIGDLKNFRKKYSEINGSFFKEFGWKLNFLCFLSFVLHFDCLVGLLARFYFNSTASWRKK